MLAALTAPARMVPPTGLVPSAQPVIASATAPVLPMPPLTACPTASAGTASLTASARTVPRTASAPATPWLADPRMELAMAAAWSASRMGRAWPVPAWL